MLKYAGIGSRQTPQDVLQAMFDIGKALAGSWILRSGHADGADLAFELGCDQNQGKKEIFIPWDGFNGASVRSGFIVPAFTDAALQIARKAHPAWDRCSTAAKKLHARNVYQILGISLDDPVDMVICWTPNASGSGGTGQAIRIAKSLNIPVFDIASQEQAISCCEFIQEKYATPVQTLPSTN